MCESIICYIPYLVTAALCLIIISMAVNNIIWVRKMHPNNTIKNVIYFFSIFQILTIVFFLSNQANWIIATNDLNPDMNIRFSWLAYDYFNKIFHILAACLLNILLKLKCSFKEKTFFNEKRNL